MPVNSVREVDPLRHNDVIVDEKGHPLPHFIRQWNTLQKVTLTTGILNLDTEELEEFTQLLQNAVTLLEAAKVAAGGATGEVYTKQSGVDYDADWQAFPASFPIVRAIRTSGDIVANGTSWVNLDTGMDLVLPAVEGDMIEVGLTSGWSNEAILGLLDMVTLVSGSPVNSFGTGGAPTSTSQGIVAWLGQVSVFTGIGGGATYPVAAGDLSGGNVTLRLRVRTFSAGNKTLRAQADLPLIVWAKNHRQ